MRPARAPRSTLERWRTDVQFLHHDLGHQERGRVVEVTLRGNAANVLLLDSTNFNRYRRGGRYTYHGGHVTRSPYHAVIPRSAHWHLVVDLGGHAGRVNASVQVLPGAMRPARQQTPSLSSIAQNAAEFEGYNDPTDVVREFDVFISHATEDKDALVRPLAHALQELGVAVWYDEFELRVGDSLRRKIDAGLASSRFGIVVLSHAFFAKNWPQYELDGLVTREMAGEQQIILPLWHEISKDEVIGHSPSLADKVALQTSLYSVSEIAEQIAEVIRERPAA
jgi:hypothetical protein